MPARGRPWRSPWPGWRPAPRPERAGRGPAEGGPRPGPRLQRRLPHRAEAGERHDLADVLAPREQGRDRAAAHLLPAARRGPPDQGPEQCQARPDPRAVRRRLRGVRGPDDLSLRRRSGEPGARRVPGRHDPDRQGPRAHVLRRHRRQGPVHHHTRAWARLPHAHRSDGRQCPQALPEAGQGPARLRGQQGQLVRVHHRVALPGRRHRPHERRCHRQPRAAGLRRGRRPGLAHRQGPQGQGPQPQPQRLLAAPLRPRRLLQGPHRAVRLQGHPAGPGSRRPATGPPAPR
ncbi:hypothetical protein SGLAM104S_04773 [Streptomyces glaucescens]